tara:strand:+ start:57828 stop:58703 length:876 start_codon:yes stop_codon:yes gene_type:complete
VSIPAEVLKKVKLLEISTRKLVNNLFTGEYHSAFKGQGMTFSEFREYVPGDDVRAISWPVTARTGKPYIKKFDEEREMTVMLAVDVSASGDYGSGPYFKGEIINHLAALLSFTAVRNNDPVGLLLFSDQVEHYVPPKKGRGQVHRILRDLYYFKPKSTKTSLNTAIEHLQATLKKKAHIFLFSDFIDSNFDTGLKMLGKKHDAVAVVISDPTEAAIPNIGLIDILDPETQELVTVDTSSPAFQKSYREKYQQTLSDREKMLRLSAVDRIDVSVGEDFVTPLVRFFKQRNLR